MDVLVRLPLYAGGSLRKGWFSAVGVIRKNWGRSLNVQEEAIVGIGMSAREDSSLKMSDHGLSRGVRDGWTSFSKRWLRDRKITVFKDLSPLFVKHQSEMQGYRLPGTMTCCSNQKEASSLCRLIPGTIFCSMSISAILTLSTADCLDELIGIGVLNNKGGTGHVRDAPDSGSRSETQRALILDELRLREGVRRFWGSVLQGDHFPQSHPHFCLRGETHSGAAQMVTVIAIAFVVAVVVVAYNCARGPMVLKKQPAWWSLASSSRCSDSRLLLLLLQLRGCRGMWRYSREPSVTVEAKKALGSRSGGTVAGGPDDQIRG
ncbi:hypothetical protein MLD38_035297 [Melastoma candidum]|uniref:Uncharacterized protein n=1 Tax=Melastoma candidum TaxID=119954 RepID=A0ACB9MEK9_9MYRT|nr:hypothetical protein MLD38_035297 [Melastoma candidum]